MKLERSEALALARQAALAVGAHDDMAASLAEATVSAEERGKGAVGFAHLLDYLDGLQKGRIDGQARPEITHPTAVVVQVNAHRGIAQLGFDQAFGHVVRRARRCGACVFTLSNSFTVGELGYYTRRLAEAGLVALAACNATAQMTTADSGQAVFGTNPLSFAAPTAEGPPFLFDQASSAAAFVRVRQAAAAGEPIPEGWAVDADGQPTTDAMAAIRGLLLPFGGARGAHIAMMVEILGAGLTGGHWSMDAPPYAEGEASPAVGLFVLALAPQWLAPGFEARLSQQLDRLARAGVRLPGRRGMAQAIDVPAALLEQVRRMASVGHGPSSVTPE
jgi:(2R)-3-sulfolactate dehydrogenase (NADP+)